MEGREEQSREHGAALGQGTLPFSRDVHNDIFDLFCKTKTSTKWKMLTAWWSILVSRERFPVQWRTTGGHHTPDDLWIGTRQTLQATWTLPTALAIKLLITPPSLGQFWGASTCWAPFAWRSDKTILFCFTPNSVSEIQCGSSVQRQISQLLCEFWLGVYCLEMGLDE